MAVAETSSSQGKGSIGESVTSGHPAIADYATIAISTLSFAVLCALGAVLWALPTPNAHAQVVAYRNAPSNQQPTVLQTANGVPQVDIQTPSAAGVSRNVYSQFDVQRNGVILNNSHANVQTQQGGWVQGNPWLATGSARVILNEVNSSNPSYLNGYVEVAGQRAEFVIANPSGISVNGGGFINTSKATLTTGTPIVNGGSLDGYRVQGGNISINGNGLDLSTTDYSVILARAVQVNAGIWANELKIVTGANQIDASSLAANKIPVTTTIAGTGAVPSFALDVAQIGGMYAGKIHLIGTEQGLGVRSAGTIGSTGGDLVLQNNGWLTTTGTLRANGNVSISTAENLDNSNTGVIAATGNVALNIATDVSNLGLISASNTLNVSSANINNSVTGELSGTTTQLSATQTLTNRGLINGIETQLNATTLNNIGTGGIFGDHVSIKADTLLNDTETVASTTSAGTIAARNRLDIAAVTLNNREHGLIFSAGDMAIGGSLDVNRQATGQATTLNNSATIEALGGLDIGSKNINNTNEHFSYEIRLASQDDNASETISSTYYRTFVRKIYLPFNTSSDPANIFSGGNMTLRSDSVTNMDSHIVAGGVLSSTGANMVNADVTATKTIHDLGLNHNYVYVPQTGNCGFIKWNCVPGHYEWQTSPYENSVNSTVFVPQPNAPQYSGKTITSVTAGNVSSNSLLPTSSMFKINVGVTSSYLVTTDPRFTNHNLWLGSDFMMQSMSFDPTISQKRLGDGFYEQKLIREQVAQLTGRRFLGNYTSDQEEYQALMTNGLTTASALNLRPGIALTAAQMAQLTSDIVWLVEQSVTLPDGSIQKVLVPQVYVQVREGDLSSSGALISGKEIDIQLSGNMSNSGSIVGTGQSTVAGRKVVSLSADNVSNLNTIQGDTVSVAAKTDVNNVGGSISAASSLSVTAERDLNIQTTTRSNFTNVGANNFSRTTIDRVAGLYVSGANGTLVASAGRDLNIVAGVVSNVGSGNTTLSAGNNASLSSVTTSSSDRDVWDANNYRKSSNSQDVGSQISGAGKVAISAGNDVNARVANVQAREALNVEAAGNVNIVAGQANSNFDEAHKFSGSGFMSSSTLVTREISSSATAQASNFGGATVAINAGKDINVKGSNVVSDGIVGASGTTLTAGGNMNIEAAQNTSSTSSYRNETSSGLMSGGGLSISYGDQMQSNDGKDTATTAAASTVGSVGGNVTITAGNQYKQVGSDVLTPKGDISITAKTVDIQEARETNKQSTEQKFEQSGLTLAVTSTVLSTLENAQSQIKATEQTSDGRMKALGTASAAANVKLAADALKAGQGDENGMVKTGNKNADGTPEMAQANAADQAGGIQVSLSYGQSSSQSNRTATSDTVRGSTVKAGGTTTIKATGAGADSNLTVQGSDVSGRQVNLEADNQVNLLAAQNTNTQTSSNSNSSASVGIALQLGASGGGLGVTGSVSKGSGSGNGTETTYTNTHVAGTDSVSIKSGSDTTLKGATVEGKQVTATVGGNLNIESLQDTANYAEQNKQIGASGMIGAGASGNVNFAKSNINSTYASVTEQSGIKAGDGGFTVNVQGNTDLKGGAITSTQAAIDNNKNTFQTGSTLTTSDIENKASYEAKSVSVSIGTGAGSGLSIPGTGLSANLSGAGMGKDSGSTSSTTTAGISGIAGDTGKRTGDNAQGIGKIFDADKVRQEIQAQTKITQEFAKQASTAIASYSDQQKQTLQDQIKKASVADKPALQQQLDQVLLEEKVLNILVGAVTGFGETAVTKEGLATAADEMRAAMVKDSSTFAGVVDSTGKKLSNVSGASEGMNGDGVKLGGTRVDLDLLCGPSNQRCATQKDATGQDLLDASGKPKLDLNSQGQVVFTGGTSKQTLDEFLATPDGKKMEGSTGGVQGYKGTLFGTPYEAGSWQDKLIESFAGTHDMIGGKLTGLYDSQGNIKQGMSKTESTAYDVWSGVAILPSAPFAAAQGLPPEVWNAIGILLKAGL